MCPGGQVVPGVALGRPHHPLESAAGGAVAAPVGDTFLQDALNCASVEVCVGFRCQTIFLQPPEVEEALLLSLSTAVLLMWIWGCCFLKSTIIYFVLLTLSERLFSWHHTPRALTSSL